MSAATVAVGLPLAGETEEGLENKVKRLHSAGSDQQRLKLTAQDLSE
jgi:hypothetical protein